MLDFYTMANVQERKPSREVIKLLESVCDAPRVLDKAPPKLVLETIPDVPTLDTYSTLKAQIQFAMSKLDSNQTCTLNIEDNIIPFTEETFCLLKALLSLHISHNQERSDAYAFVALSILYATAKRTSTVSVIETSTVCDILINALVEAEGPYVKETIIASLRYLVKGNTALSTILAEVPEPWKLPLNILVEELKRLQITEKETLLDYLNARFEGLSFVEQIKEFCKC